MLNSLIHTNWTAKYHTLLSVLRGFLQSNLTQSNSFSSNQNTLWIQAMSSGVNVGLFELMMMKLRGGVAPFTWRVILPSSAAEETEAAERDLIQSEFDEPST